MTRPTFTWRRRQQRTLVVAALFVLVVSLLVLPEGHEPAAEAGLASTQPCGPSDAYRNTLTLSNGDVIRPCLSKANLKIRVTGGGNYSNDAFRINKIRTANNGDVQTLRYADGSTEQLRQVTFESFVIFKGATMTVTPPAGGPSYSLTMKPDLAAQVGGEGINTDLWVTGSSYVKLQVLGLCSTTATIDTFANLDWLLNGSSWDGCEMDMDIRLLAVYKPGSTTTGSYPIKLPNTTVDVTPK